MMRFLLPLVLICCFLPARGRAELMSLVLESMTSAARQGGLSAEHLRLCESMLATLGRP